MRYKRLFIASGDKLVRSARGSANGYNPVEVEPTNLTMWIATLLFLLCLILWIYISNIKPKNYPPGPKWLPVLGSFLTIAIKRKQSGYFYKVIAELSEKYGSVIGLKIGRDLVVAVYGKEEIRELLLNGDLIGRPTGLFFQMRTWGERLGVLLTDGNQWQEQRQFIVRHLKEFGFGSKTMSTMIQEEAKFMVDNFACMLKNKQTVIVNMHDAFNIHVLNTLWKMLAGARFNADDRHLKKLQEILGQLFASVDMIGAAFSHFPLLRFLAPESSGYKLYVETHLAIWDFLEKELERHKGDLVKDNAKDFMDKYLNELKLLDGKESFSEKQLLAICIDLFMAGSETTSKTLAFCFLNLLLFPDVQRKAQQEIDSVIGRERAPTLEDRPLMPYMECVVLEALRMFSGRTFTVPHRALRDTLLNGYFIPKDTMVIAHLHGTFMGRNSGVDDPETFKPERYLKNGKVVVPNTFIPFGVGKRRCLGESLARANVFLFTSFLLQRFNFSVVTDCPPINKSTDGVTPGPLPFKAIVTQRE